MQSKSLLPSAKRRS